MFISTNSSSSDRLEKEANWPVAQMLRHNCATKVRRRYGLEGAWAVLGHKIGIVTEIYAERDF